MDILTILAALPENIREDAKTFINGLNPLQDVDTKEKALAFMESNDLLKSAFDSKVTNSVDTFKVNNQVKVDLEIATKKEELEKEFSEKANPTLTDDQRLIKTLSDKLDKSLTEGVKDKQLIVAQKHTKGKIFDGINLDMYLCGTDLETREKLDKMLIEPYKLHTDNQLSKLNEEFTKAVNDKLNIKLPKSGNFTIEGIDEQIKAAGAAQNFPLQMELMEQKANTEQ